MPLQIIRQDITKMRVDAIVNTTNEEMLGHSGVDLAVHMAAGEGLDAECRELAPLGLGQAKISSAYDLPCKHVIHTSGPVWRGGLLGEEIILRSCYVESLKLALEYKCRSVAFPLISSGVYGYPKDRVLKFAVRTITEFLFENELTVYICVFDRESYSFSQKLFSDIKEFIGEEDSYYRDDGLCGRYEYDSDALPPENRINLPKITRRTARRHASQAKSERSVAGKSLYEYLEQKDQSFREMLFDLIDRSGMTDVECYKKANVDKRVFSKIKSNNDYRPSKQTAIAFAISLHLSLDETQALLATAGFTLSMSTVFDKIIRYFIQTENYDVFEINEALFEFDQKLLGSL